MIDPRGRTTQGHFFATFANLRSAKLFGSDLVNQDQILICRDITT